MTLVRHSFWHLTPRPRHTAGLTSAGPPESPKPLHPPNFDNVDVQDPAPLTQIEVVKSLCGGVTKGAQVLLCKILRRPSVSDDAKHARLPVYFPKDGSSTISFVVAKVFDPVFYPQSRSLDSNYTGDTVASLDMSREASVFEFCYKEKMTGYPHIVPQYYGSWIGRVENSAADGQNRYVSLILMEYVEGKTIEQMCTRDKKTDFLVLPKAPVALHYDPEGQRRGTMKRLDMTLESRMAIVTQVLKGIVAHVHKLIEHEEFQPENLIVTLRREGIDLPKPHVYLLDFNLSSIWYATKEGRQDPNNAILSLPNPPHPWMRCSIESKIRFIGWIPRRWTNDDFTSWMIREFGPHTGLNQNYFTFSAE
ncbi:hypothetical protein CMUS01_02500 [Colletotrichum musicola]|uniref:Protein kinase domain-containing protein n=1 Tax=Colletotrichum musicola TaxID=2175873 RepID=A0A8H6NUX5_9PEZI|nr:hypothetical protein CMUS01_02500 [Colletotrichum musicola]